VRGAIGVLFLGLAHFGWILPRLDDWLGPQEERVLKAAFVAHMQESPADGVVYLRCEQVDWRKLVAAIPWRIPAGVVFIDAASFKPKPGWNGLDSWRDPTSGRHFQLLTVTLGSVSLTQASVAISWRYAPMAGGITNISLERGWRGWKVTKRENSADI
jgi:hypothetical protein